MQPMYCIGLDVHKRTISYCVKDSSGVINSEGSLPALRSRADKLRRLLSSVITK
jgi:transposase